MSALSARDRRAVTLGAAVVLLALAVLYVVRPVVQRVSAQRDALEREQDLLARERDLVRTAPQLPAALAAWQRALAGEEEHAIVVSTFRAAGARLGEQLRSLARSNNVRIVQVAESPADSLSAAAYSVRLTLRGESDVRGVLRLVRAIEFGTLRARVRTLQIERAAQGPRAPNAPPADETLSMTLTVDAPVVLRAAGSGR